MAAVTQLLGRPPYFGRIGGSVPVYDVLLSELGAHAIAFGFGANDEGQHAPNEFLRLENFRKGPHGYGLLLHELAGMGK